MSAIVPQFDTQVLQDLFLEPVSMTLYELVTLRKLRDGRNVGQRGISHLIKEKLIYRVGDSYYFSPGVRNFLEKHGEKDSNKTRTVTARSNKK